jgi:gluconate kinase
VQPDNLGKFVFISGPPGAGKSSIAAWLALNAQYVYYEGDGFMFGLNPYTPANESEPFLAAQVQHPLLGEGMHERKAIIDRFNVNFGAGIGDYTKVDRNIVNEFITALADDISNERRRLGGDWIVAFAVLDLMSRDLLRSLLGEDLVFVVLQLSPELQEERLADRNADEQEVADLLSSIYEIYEPAGVDEERAIGFDQKAESSIEENSEEVLNLINVYYNST